MIIRRLCELTVVRAFNPEMLALARRSRQLSQLRLAEFSGVKNASISKYEAGVLPITENALDRLAATLDYPRTFFTRSTHLAGLGGGAFWHRKQQQMPVKTLYRAHAIAEIRRLEVMTMMEILGTEFPAIPEYPVEMFDDDPAKIARSVRNKMNVPPGPIFSLINVLEQRGCVVIAHDFKSRQIDGFSQNTGVGPCFIHINADLPSDRARWTLAHELGHAVMHMDTIIEPKLAEAQADLFAAEFLTPAHEIRHMLDGLTFPKLAGLKRKWKVSMQALIMRAFQLGSISARQRATMFKRLSAAGYRTREPETLDPPMEHPTVLSKFARSHIDEAGYNLAEFQELIAINQREFLEYYVADDDIIRSLGIGDLLDEWNQDGDI